MPIAVNDAGDAVYLTQDGNWEPAKIAENPTTKERLAFDGKDWVPFKTKPKAEWSYGDLGMAAVRGIPIAGGIVERFSSPESQKEYKRFDEAHPYLSGAAKFGGGVAALGPLGMTAAGARLLGMTGPTIARQVINSGVSGAAIGGLDEATRGGDIGAGSAIGGAFGAGAPLVGRAIGAAIAGTKNAVTPITRSPSNFQRVGNIDVPLDRGQATGDVVAQRYIETGRQGNFGEAAQREVNSFRDAQAQAVEAAKQDIRGSIGGARATPLEAAEAAQQGLIQRANAAKGAAQAKYDEFGALQGRVQPHAFDGIAGRIEQELASGQTPIFVSDAGRTALNNLETTLQRHALTDKGAGISIQGIDAARKQLLARSRAFSPMEANEKMLFGKIIERFDDHAQNVIGSALYSGDPAALGTLKEARRLWAAYAQTFKGRNGMADNVVQNMIGKNGNPADHNQIVNWIYGSSGIGGQREASLVAQKLKSILGETSPEWQAVRQGLFSKIVDTVEGRIQDGPQKIAQRIAEFLNGGGKQVAPHFFSTTERALIDQYGQLMRKMTPAVGAINHSNSGYQIASMMKWTLNALATIGGLHVGGPMGALAGVAANSAGKGMIEASHARAIARNLYNPASAPIYPAQIAPRAQKAGALLGRSALGI